MDLILLCHLTSWLHWDYLPQLFNVGVPLFLLISGYLSGGRFEKQPSFWLKKRLTKICVPMYLLAGFLVCYTVITEHHFRVSEIFVYLFNLQGTRYMFPLPIWAPEIPGTRHLWFLTAIMLCYCMTAVFYKAEDHHPLSKRFFIGLLVVILCAQCALFSFQIQLLYFATYFLGFFLARFPLKNKLGLKYCLLTVVMLIGLGLRFYLRETQRDAPLYVGLVVPLTHTALALWILGTITLLYRRFPAQIRNMTENFTWRLADQLSFFVFLTHYMFLVGPFQLPQSHPFMGTLLFFVLSFVSAFALFLVTRIPSILRKQKLFEI